MAQKQIAAFTFRAAIGTRVADGVCCQFEGGVWQIEMMRIPLLGFRRRADRRHGACWRRQRCPTGSPGPDLSMPRPLASSTQTSHALESCPRSSYCALCPPGPSAVGHLPLGGQGQADALLGSRQLSFPKVAESGFGLHVARFLRPKFGWPPGRFVDGKEAGDGSRGTRVFAP